MNAERSALISSRLIVTMGVSGSGKTVTGKAIARRLHAPFLDADDFHPVASKEKMRLGLPLTDDDRWPWLGLVARALHDAAEVKGIAVGACSALKRAYRDRLVAEAGEPILFVLLEGDAELIGRRLAARTHDYMPPSLLASQLETLEAPAAGENVVIESIAREPEVIADRVVKALPHLRSFRRKQ